MGTNHDKVVVSFCDSIIRQSDLKLLEGPHWLNDRIIGFYFEYLFEKEFDSSDKLVFISPEVCQFLKMSRKEEETNVSIVMLSLGQKKSTVN